MVLIIAPPAGEPPHRPQLAHLGVGVMVSTCWCADSGSKEYPFECSTCQRLTPGESDVYVQHNILEPNENLGLV